MIGKQVLNYKIKSLIGEGGMGNVYHAEHESIGRKVAIKVLRSELAGNPEIRQRFKNEASVMAHLQHPGIVTLYDYVEQEDDLYLIMEYVEGKELKVLLNELSEPLPFKRVRDIMTKMLNAFELAHKKGVVHRDMKPSNVLITEGDDVKILDFGIAKLLGNEGFKLTKTGTQVGTIYYMSPEQVRAKELDLRSDIYSLGIMFYELLAGFCPYTSMTSEYEIYEKIVKEPLLPLTESMGKAYEGVWRIVRKATDKDPEKRFQSCKEFSDVLNGKVKLTATGEYEKPKNQKAASTSQQQATKSQSNEQAKPQTNTQGQEKKVPDSGGALTCGILSAVFALLCGLGGALTYGVLSMVYGVFGLVGILLGIIAISLGSSGVKNYKNSPNDYSSSSYNSAKAGVVLGIIGLSLSSIMFVINIIQ